MIIEYIRFGLTDAVQARHFERDCALAVQRLARHENCLQYELARCMDQPLQYILQIRWDVAVAPRPSPPNPSDALLSELSAPYRTQLLERRQYEATSVSGLGPGRRRALET